MCHLKRTVYTMTSTSKTSNNFNAQRGKTDLVASRVGFCVAELKSVTTASNKSWTDARNQQQCPQNNIFSEDNRCPLFLSAKYWWKCASESSISAKIVWKRLSDQYRVNVYFSMHQNTRIRLNFRVGLVMQLHKLGNKRCFMKVNPLKERYTRMKLLYNLKIASVLWGLS